MVFWGCRGNATALSHFWEQLNMIRILYKNSEAVAVFKPIGMASVPDKSADADAMTLTAEYLRSERESADLFPVHRLDRVVQGILVFARNAGAARELSKLVSEEGGMGKEYLAVVEGAAPGGEMRDYIRKEQGIGKATVTVSGVGGAKEATLSYTALSTKEAPKGKRTLVSITLGTGRFHQIRVQFSSRGMPLVGDGKYGSRDKTVRTPALIAYRLSFVLKGENITLVEYPTADDYPWSLFSEEIEDLKK